MPMNGEAGLLNLRQRQIVFSSFQVAHRHPSTGRNVRRRHYLDFHVPADRREPGALYRRPFSDESSPIAQRHQRSLQSRRRDFQHIPSINHAACRVELCLERPRRPFTITDLNALPIEPVNSDAENRASTASPDPDIDKLIPKGLNFFLDNRLQAAIHVISAIIAGTKKCGAPSPTSDRLA